MVTTQSMDTDICVEENDASLVIRLEKEGDIKNKWNWDWLRCEVMIVERTFQFGQFIRKGIIM